MNKAALLRTPWPDRPPKDVTATARILHEQGVDVLEFIEWTQNTYRPPECGADGRWLVWHTEAGLEFAKQNEPGGKERTGAPYDYWWSSVRTVKVPSASADAIRTFMGWDRAAVNNRQAVTGMEGTLKNLNEERLDGKWAATRKQAEIDIAGIPPLPPEIDRWVEGNSAGANDNGTAPLGNERYIFYKKGRGRCSHCGGETTAEELNGGFGGKFEHRKQTACAVCGTNATAFAAGIGKKALKDYHCFYAVSDVGGKQYIVRYECHKEYEGLDEPWEAKIRYDLADVTVVDGTRAVGYYPGYCDGRRNITVTGKGKAECWNIVRNASSKHVWNIPVYLDGSVRRSDLWKRGVDALEPPRNKSSLTVRYIMLLGAFPQAEYLLKAGYTELLRELCREYGIDRAQRLNKKGRTPAEVLGIPGWVLKKIDRAALTVDGILAIREMAAAGGMDEAGIRLAVYGRNASAFFAEMHERMSYTQMEHYIEKQAKNGMSKNTVVIEWSDTVQMAKQLGERLDDHRVRTPKDLHTFHNRLSDRVEMKKHPEAVEKIKAVAQKADERFAMEDERHLIRAVRDYEELCAEGRILSHCVASYAGRIDEKKCVILVLRKKDDPETPLVTVEIDPGSLIVRQAYGVNDTPPKPPEKAFLEKYRAFLAEGGKQNKKTKKGEMKNGKRTDAA